MHGNNTGKGTGTCSKTDSGAFMAIPLMERGGVLVVMVAALTALKGGCRGCPPFAAQNEDWLSSPSNGRALPPLYFPLSPP